ncbi:hypothetical protein CLOM_g1982 [Closterium sp. NIES-68]|nr:hypothetical protein CLOM_g1982 [Closterium sp. NIES-68]
MEDCLLRIVKKHIQHAVVRQLTREVGGDATYETAMKQMESAHRGTAGPSCCSTTLTMQVWRVVPPTFSTTPSTRGHARTPGASA